MRPRSPRRVNPYLWDWQVAIQKMLNDYSPVQGLNNFKIIYFVSNLHLRPADPLHLSQFSACKIRTYIPAEPVYTNFWNSESEVYTNRGHEATRLRGSRIVDPYLWD